MTPIEKAIKHFECVKNDAKAVLDSGFGTKPNESNIVYKNRKLYAELAINALEKQIPKKVKEFLPLTRARCPACNEIMGAHASRKYCYYCGQALDWSDSE